MFNKTQDTSWSKVILDFVEIEFASKSFLDELNALIKKQDEKTYVKKNMSKEVQKMDKFVQRSQEDIMRDSPRKSEEADMVAI